MIFGNENNNSNHSSLDSFEINMTEIDDRVK